MTAAPRTRCDFHRDNPDSPAGCAVRFSDSVGGGLRSALEGERCGHRVASADHKPATEALDQQVLSLLRERGPCPYSALQPDLDDPIAAAWALERLRQRGLITWDDSRPAVYRALPAAELTD